MVRVRYANAFCEQERGYETGAMVGQQLHGFEQQRLLDGQAIITDAGYRVRALWDILMRAVHTVMTLGIYEKINLVSRLRSSRVRIA